MREYSLDSVTAVMRTYSNNFAAKNAVEMLLQAGVGGIILVVRYEQASDRDKYLAHFRDVGKKLTIVPLQAEEYSWTTALNRGAITATQRQGCQMILNISVEANINTACLREAVAHLKATEASGVVYFPFDDTVDKNGAPLQLGPTYQVPRNTCMLVHVRSFTCVAGFSVRCDQHGGMEDVLFCLQLANRGIGIHRYSPPVQENHGAVVRLVVNKTPEGQQEKEQNEAGSIKSMLKWLKDQCGWNDEEIQTACRQIGMSDL